MSRPEIDIDALQDIGKETAELFLIESAGSVAALLKLLTGTELKTMEGHPMLVAVAALLRLLDCRAEERRIQQTAMIEALHDLQESIDFMAARPDGDEAGEMPTESEKIVIYRALEERYLKRIKRSGQAVSTNEIEADLRRFKKIAWL